MFGLGKKRSKFGKWLDRQGIQQIELEKIKIKHRHYL